MKRGVERCDRSAIDNGTYLQAVIVVNPNTVHHIRIFLAAHIIIIQIKPLTGNRPFKGDVVRTIWIAEKIVVMVAHAVFLEREHFRQITGIALNETIH